MVISKTKIQNTPGPFQDAVFNMFVFRGMTIDGIAAKFGGRVPTNEIRVALSFAASRPVRVE